MYTKQFSNRDTFNKEIITRKKIFSSYNKFIPFIDGAERICLDRSIDEYLEDRFIIEQGLKGAIRIRSFIDNKKVKSIEINLENKDLIAEKYAKSYSKTTNIFRINLVVACVNIIGCYVFFLNPVFLIPSIALMIYSVRLSIVAKQMRESSKEWIGKCTRYNRAVDLIANALAKQGVYIDIKGSCNINNVTPKIVDIDKIF